jgi:hypothetical protein
VKLEPGPPNDRKMPSPDPNVKRRNWIVLVVLVAVAMAMYVSFMLKMMANHS